MNVRTIRTLAAAGAAAVLAAGVFGSGAMAAGRSHPGAAGRPAGHYPHFMATLTPPPVQLPVGIPIPAAGEPVPVNMSYFGGPVLLHPRVYLVFWGWHGDPDGVAKRLEQFFGAVGGSSWENVVTQYYQQRPSSPTLPPPVGTTGPNEYIKNPAHQLHGVWWDNRDPIHDFLSPLDLAREAERAVWHFNRGVVDTNANYFIATPKYANEALFNESGYCAWHDYTLDKYYPGVMQHISFTNFPYVLNAGGGCGENYVNSGRAGRLDGVTIAAGHEYLESVTDPGAEDVIGGEQGTNQLGENFGGWYDFNGYENGDKCAWVLPGLPGGVQDMRFGRYTFPVQATWSNDDLNGVGYCSASAG